MACGRAWCSDRAPIRSGGRSRHPICAPGAERPPARTSHDPAPFASPSRHDRSRGRLLDRRQPGLVGAARPRLPGSPVGRVRPPGFSVAALFAGLAALGAGVPAVGPGIETVRSSLAPLRSLLGAVRRVLGGLLAPYCSLRLPLVGFVEQLVARLRLECAYARHDLQRAGAAAHGRPDQPRSLPQRRADGLVGHAALLERRIGLPHVRDDPTALSLPLARERSSFDERSGFLLVAVHVRAFGEPSAHRRLWTFQLAHRCP